MADAISDMVSFCGARACTKLNRKNSHDCRGQFSNVLAVLIGVEAVIQKAKKFLARPADVFWEADGGTALLPVFVDDQR